MAEKSFKDDLVIEAEASELIRRMFGESTAAAPKKQESKTAHLQILIKPSLKEKLRQAADEAGISMNDYVNRLLEKALNRKGR